MPVRETGFTLIEILVAIVILTVGLLAVAKMQVSAIQGNYFSNSATTALNLAQAKMEDLLSRSFTDTDLVDTQPGNNGNLTSITVFDHEETDSGNPTNIDDGGNHNPQGIFRRVWNVADYTPPTEIKPITKTITIIVTWTKGANTHSVNLSCIKRQ